MKEKMRFTVGDTVTWKSQSHGYYIRKTGTVVAVVPAGREPFAYIPSGGAIRNESTVGNERGHESYLIRVSGKHRQLYWPRVSQLRKINFTD